MLPALGAKNQNILLVADQLSHSLPDLASSLMRFRHCSEINWRAIQATGTAFLVLQARPALSIARGEHVLRSRGQRNAAEPKTFPDPRYALRARTGDPGFVTRTGLQHGGALAEGLAGRSFPEEIYHAVDLDGRMCDSVFACLSCCMHLRFCLMSGLAATT
jgi:hypothetical protein